MTSHSHTLMQLLGGRINLSSGKNINWNQLHPICTNNGLSPWIYLEYGDLIKEKDLYYRDMALNGVINEMLLHEAEILEQLYPHFLTRIKGSALRDLLYDNNCGRVFYDIDFLVEKSHIDEITTNLLSRGFHKYIQAEWSATQNRTNYSKDIGKDCQVNIDLHTNLFWEEKTVEWNFIIDKNKKYLAHEDHFFYLIVNWAFQDTYVSLNKFLDLILFWRKMAGTWNENRIIELIKLHNLDRVFQMVLGLIEKWGHLNTFSMRSKLSPAPDWLSEMLSPNFLTSPQSFPVKYFFLKHMSKADLFQAIRYDLGWMSARTLTFIRTLPNMFSKHSSS